MAERYLANSERFNTSEMTDEQIIDELRELGVDASKIHAAPKTKQ